MLCLFENSAKTPNPIIKIMSSLFASAAHLLGPDKSNVAVDSLAGKTLAIYFR